MNVDLKRLYTSDTPKFRRGDTVIILFNFYDDGEEYDINSATKAQVHQKTSKGNIIVTDCTFEYYKGKRVVKFEVEDVAMVEFGYLNLLLTVYQGNDVISIQPFNVLVYDDYMGGASSFIDLIQELQKLIENMVIDLNNAIKLTEKGVANGVATLDANGKVPLKQLPAEFDALLEHITQTVFEHQVHGLKIDDDGLMMYKDKNGNWQYVGFSDTGVGGGTTDLLQAEIVVEDGIATVTYTGKPTVNTSKWATGDRQITYFLLNGTTFTGATFPVSSLGIHTLYYKDSNGVEYVKVFNVTADMMGKPNVDIDVNDGFVTVTPPSNLGISIKKWAKGSRTVSYFAYNGTVFTGNTLEVTEIGTYTVYIKTTTGLEYVYEFEVTQEMLPPVSNIAMKVTTLSLWNNSTNAFIVISKVKDDNYAIVKVKNATDTTYVDLNYPLEAGKEHSYMDFNKPIDFSLSSNRNREIVIGFENSNGNRTEWTLYADSNYIYYWDNMSNEASLAFLQVNSSAWNSSSITFPSSIKGKTITKIGELDNITMINNDKVTTLTIPSSIKNLYPIFSKSSKLTTVNVLNSNMEYNKGSWAYAFTESTNQITLKAKTSSTTQTFVQERQGDPLYKLKFQAT